eukprot:388827-Amphidinium_carterae.1
MLAFAVDGRQKQQQQQKPMADCWRCTFKRDMSKKGDDALGGPLLQKRRCVWASVGSILLSGADKGGIVVRTGRDTTTEQCAERLATGAIVEEVDLAGD